MMSSFSCPPHNTDPRSINNGGEGEAREAVPPLHLFYKYRYPYISDVAKMPDTYWYGFFSLGLIHAYQ